MQSPDLDNLKTINTIIERDSKDTTYKYALLRGAVEISQEYQHLKYENGDRIEFPLGLLVEKWLLYYYPFIESDIPQKPGECEKKFAIHEDVVLIGLVKNHPGKKAVIYINNIAIFPSVSDNLISLKTADIRTLLIITMRKELIAMALQKENETDLIRKITSHEDDLRKIYKEVYPILIKLDPSAFVKLEQEKIAALKNLENPGSIEPSKAVAIVKGIVGHTDRDKCKFECFYEEKMPDGKMLGTFVNDRIHQLGINYHDFWPYLRVHGWLNE